jgi:pantetheine-phosphate adenylyltransferase
MKAIYPGSFDPITLGHLDIITRASRLFDELIVVVAQNSTKQGLFTADERVELIKASCQGLNNIVVKQTEGLIVDFASSQGARLMIRSVRNSDDTTFESQLALMNQTLSPNIETLFMPCKPELSHIASSLVKEIAKLNGDINSFLPKPAADALRQKLKG